MLTLLCLIFLSGNGQEKVDYPSGLQNQNCVVLDLTESVSYGKENLKYEWDFGDGSTGAGIVTEHCYEARGTYLAVLKVTDTLSTASFPDEIEVEVNISPEVLVSIDAQKAEEGYSLKGEFSAPEDVKLIGFYWDVDGEYYIGEAPEVKVKDQVEVRLLARFESDGKEGFLAKTIVTGI